MEVEKSSNVICLKSGVREKHIVSCRIIPFKHLLLECHYRCGYNRHRTAIGTYRRLFALENPANAPEGFCIETLLVGPASEHRLCKKYPQQGLYWAVASSVNFFTYVAEL